MPSVLPLPFEDAAARAGSTPTASSAVSSTASNLTTSTGTLAAALGTLLGAPASVPSTSVTAPPSVISPAPVAAPIAAPVLTPGNEINPIQLPVPAGGKPPLTENGIAADLGVDKSGSVGNLDIEQINAVLAAIEAQFNGDRNALLADQSELGFMYKLLTNELARAQGDAQASAEGGALQRGVFRSGIHAGDQARIAQEFALQEAAIARENEMRTNAITQQLASLQAQQAAAQSQAAVGLAQQQLGADADLAAALALVPEFNQAPQ